MKKAIVNGRIISKGEIIDNRTVIIEDEKIADIVNGIPDSFDGEITDAKGSYISSGFIDIHTHGGGGYDYMDGTEEAFVKAFEAHMKHGTTSTLATTLTSSNEELYKTFEVYEKANSREDVQFLGLHLEGPYFNPIQCGAQDTRYIKNPEYEDYQKIYDNSKGFITRWSVAPELPGFDEFADFLKEKGIIGSIAHTDGYYEDAVNAYNRGIRLYTHFYSCMPSIRRVNGYRKMGIIEAGYMLDDISVEIIADGHHVPPELINMVYKFKGKDKMILITDSMRGAATDSKTSVLGSLKDGQPVEIADGVARIPGKEGFAGSVATADVLVHTIYKKAGIPLPEAIQMITENPANAINLKGKGLIHKGYDADIVIFDDNINIESVFIKGKNTYSK